MLASTNWVRSVARSLLSPLRPLRDLWAWNQREKAFRDYLRNLPLITDRKSSDNSVWIVIQPWLMTPLPWFMLTLALALYQRGCQVRVIWDDTAFGKHEPFRQQVQQSIGRIYSMLPEYIDKVRLSDVPPIEKPSISELTLQRFADDHTIEIIKGECRTSQSDKINRSILKSLGKTAKHIQALFESNRPDYVVVGGGLYASSCLFMHFGQANKVRVASIDCGLEKLLLSVNGIAANLADIPLAYSMLSHEDAWVVSVAQNELNRRMTGAERSSFERDTSSYQLVASSGYEKTIGVLLPLNISYDTAALGRHAVFANQQEWMLDTVDWVLNHSSENIVVRQHPAEHIPEYKSKDDYQSALESRFGHNPRLLFLPASASVNTYDLILQSKVVVPNTSTVGVEATALGKPVVTEGGSYYANLGFVWNANTREDYFNLLGKAIKRELIVSEQQVNAAWRCYYLTQCCNVINTLFTPNPYDFYKWIKLNHMKLFSLPEVVAILQSLDEGIPISIIRHREKANQLPISSDDPKGLSCYKP